MHIHRLSVKKDELEFQNINAMSQTLNKLTTEWIHEVVYSVYMDQICTIVL